MLHRHIQIHPYVNAVSPRPARLLLQPTTPRLRRLSKPRNRQHPGVHTLLPPHQTRSTLTTLDTTHQRLTSHTGINEQPTRIHRIRKRTTPVNTPEIHRNNLIITPGNPRSRGARPLPDILKQRPTPQPMTREEHHKRLRTRTTHITTNPTIKKHTQQPPATPTQNLKLPNNNPPHQDEANTPDPTTRQTPRQAVHPYAAEANAQHENQETCHPQYRKKSTPATPRASAHRKTVGPDTR
jgi:hypothetical protein